MTPAAQAEWPSGVDPPAEESGYFVYGVVGAQSRRVPDELLGLDDAPVRAVVHGDVAAVVGPVTLDRPPGRRAELVAYSRVVDALAASGPVVPVQFGSILLDEQDIVEDLLAPNEQYFAELLEELAGRAQFNLRATYLEPVVLAEVVATHPEIAELRERTRHLPEDSSYGDRVRLGELVSRALEDRRDHDSEVLLDAVLPWTAAHVVRSGAGVDHVLDVALLVDDSRRTEFEAQLEGLAEAVHERMRLRLVGPVAPYDFVGGA